MVCGGQMPRDVVLEQSRDYYRYVCPECGASICEGVVSEGGEPADSPASPPRHPTHIDTSVDWATWEVWWTNRLVVSIIHGVVVGGEKEMADFVRSLEEKHDDNS